MDHQWQKPRRRRREKLKDWIRWTDNNIKKRSWLIRQISSISEAYLHLYLAPTTHWCDVYTNDTGNQHTPYFHKFWISRRELREDFNWLRTWLLNDFAIQSSLYYCFQVLHQKSRRWTRIQWTYPGFDWLQTSFSNYITVSSTTSRLSNGWLQLATLQMPTKWIKEKNRAKYKWNSRLNKVSTMHQSTLPWKQ